MRVFQWSFCPNKIGGVHGSPLNVQALRWMSFWEWLNYISLQMMVCRRLKILLFRYVLWRTFIRKPDFLIRWCVYCDFFCPVERLVKSSICGMVKSSYQSKSWSKLVVRWFDGVSGFWRAWFLGRAIIVKERSRTNNEKWHVSLSWNQFFIANWFGNWRSSLPQRGVFWRISSENVLLVLKSKFYLPLRP